MTIIKKVQVKIKGATPLIMSNVQMADPQNPLTKEIKLITSKRNKTDEDELLIRDLQFRGSLYWDQVEMKGLYMPTENLRKMIFESAKKCDLKKARELISGISFENYLGYPLITEDRDNLDKLMNNKNLRYTKIVAIQKAKVVNTRSIFDRWALTFDLTIDTSILNVATAKRWFEYAGGRVGLGGRRPGAPTPGEFGKFLIETFDIID
jgi:hypothetical protein